jgi:hypothetical protein
MQETLFFGRLFAGAALGALVLMLFGFAVLFYSQARESACRRYPGWGNLPVLVPFWIILASIVLGYWLPLPSEEGYLIGEPDLWFHPLEGIGFFLVLLGGSAASGVIHGRADARKPQGEAVCETCGRISRTSR